MECGYTYLFRPGILMDIHSKMAAGGDEEVLVREFYRLCIEKTSVGQKLSDEDKKHAKSVAVKKVIKEGLALDNTTINNVDASIFPKYADKKTKKLSEEDFVTKLLPDVAAMKAKVKDAKDPKAQEELSKMKKKLAAKCTEWKTQDSKTKNAAVVDRLTDTKGYTGSHKERFDESGKGKGLEGREEKVDGSGYVGNYKGAGTFDKK